jgi:tetratricopeptide (TPR) repeat protein
VALYKSGQTEACFEMLAKARELNPEIASVDQHWGTALIQQRRYAEAIPFLESAHQEDPGSADIMLNLAMALARTGRFDEALDKLLELEKRDRWNPNVHYMLGTHFLGLGEFKKAISHLEKALEEQPDYEDAAINLSLALSETGDTLEAVRRMRPVIRRLPNSAPVNFFYGTMLYRNGELKEALVKYEKAIELNPDYIEPRIGQGEIYLKQEDTTRAQDALLWVLTRDDHCIPALFLMGLTLIRKAEQQAQDPLLYQDALFYFERVISIAPDHLDSWANRAYIQGRLESVEAMNSEFERLSARYDGDLKSVVLFYWAKTLEQFNLSEAAAEKREEARRMNPEIERQFEIFAL